MSINEYATGYDPKTLRWTAYNRQGVAVWSEWTEEALWTAIDSKERTGSWFGEALTPEQGRRLTVSVSNDGIRRPNIWKD